MTPYIPDYFAEVVKKTSLALNRQIFFDFGHYEDVAGRQQLKAKGGSDATRQRYPLVWLVMDFEEQRLREDGIVMLNPSPMVIIAVNTQITYSMRERRDKTFLPVLYPIYDEFIRQLTLSVAFRQPGIVRHTKVDRPYWNGEGGNGNLFSESVDAIQLKNFTELQINPKVACIIT